MRPSQTVKKPEARGPLCARELWDLLQFRAGAAVFAAHGVACEDETHENCVRNARYGLQFDGVLYIMI